MPSLQPLASPLSLSAIRSPQSNPGLKPATWKIRPAQENTQINTSDSFSRQTPTIRSLDLNKLPSKTALLPLSTTIQQPQEPELSQTNLLQALELALTNLSNPKHQQTIHPLIEAAKEILVIAPAPTNKALEQILIQPRSLALRERLAARIHHSLERFENELETGNSPRLKQMNKLLSAGLHLIELSVTGKKKLSQAEQTEALVALSMSQAMGFLVQDANPAAQASRLQAWALLLEEQSQTTVLNPQKLIDIAMQLQPKADLQAEMQSSLNLLVDLGNLGESEAKALLTQPLTGTAGQILSLIQEMQPAELQRLGAGLQSLHSEIQNDWMPAWNDLNSEIGERLSEAAGLSSEAQALIKKADELALRLLSPKPEPPQGFEDGLLSLIQAFKKILQQLDKDQSALFLADLSRVLALRKRDNSFLDKLQSDLRYDLSSRQERENLNAQIEARYQNVLTQLQDTLAA
jgi:hypothetical protein